MSKHKQRRYVSARLKARRRKHGVFYHDAVTLDKAARSWARMVYKWMGAVTVVFSTFWDEMERSPNEAAKEVKDGK